MISALKYRSACLAVIEADSVQRDWTSDWWVDARLKARLNAIPARIFLVIELAETSIGKGIQILEGALVRGVGFVLTPQAATQHTW